MRLNRFIILFAFALLTVTACTPIDSTATPTGGIIGIPTYETPEGLLPAALEAGADPAPTMQPVEEGEFQTVEMPDLGVSITVPAGWTSERSGDVYVIEDADGETMMQVGAAYGLTPTADGVENKLNLYLNEQGISQDSFTVEQSVIGIYNYVVVTGSGIDACQYAYLPVLLSAVVLKFERPTCDESGNLNSDAFAIWRSTALSNPTE